jgi:Uma2 family endonuclease
MQVAVKHRFTVGDYHRLGQAGVLRPGARVELLDGEIIDRSPIGPPHGGVVNRLLRLFARISPGRFLVSVQNPLRLDEHSEPQPDLMLLRPAPDDYTTDHPGPEDVLLLIEVAETSLEFDRGEKLSAYARAGVVEVWIVNLTDGTIEVFRQPGPAGYASTTLLRPGDIARPLASPDAAVDVAELLRR